MPLSFEQKITVPQSVMFRELEGEAVILHLDSERYFGLDDVGTRMWQLVTTSPSIQAAYEALLDEFDVEAETLRGDLEELLGTLQERGLVELSDE